MNRGIQMYCISELCCLQVRSNAVLHVCMCVCVWIVSTAWEESVVNFVRVLLTIAWNCHLGRQLHYSNKGPLVLKVLIKSIALTRTSSPQLWNEDGYYNKPLIWPQRKILCSYLIIVLLLNKFSANYQLAEKWTSLWTITPESLYRYMQC